VDRCCYDQIRPNLAAFRQGLRELGYVNGRNIVVEFRSVEGQSDRLADLAAELVRKKVDVFVTSTTIVAQAAKKLTTTIPIVIVATGDPIGTGW
jgi:putative ABC transport system substrate-binding protein